MVQTAEKLNQEISQDTNFSLDKLSVQQLIDLAVSSYEDLSGFNSRVELIKRGKDNIQSRITIKKACKATILSHECNSDKAKLLSSVSVLDKLQLEWQKHDLILKNQ